MFKIIVIFKKAGNIIELTISAEVKDVWEFTATFSRPMCLIGLLFKNFSNLSSHPLKKSVFRKINWYQSIKQNYMKLHFKSRGEGETKEIKKK
jgi:hypothetical protein